MKLYLDYAVHDSSIPDSIRVELQRMVRENKLIFKGGFYKVNPKKRYFKDIIDRHFEQHKNRILKRD